MLAATAVRVNRTEDVRDALRFTQVRSRMIRMDVPAVQHLQKQVVNARNGLFRVVLHLLSADEVEVLNLASVDESIEVSLRELCFVQQQTELAHNRMFRQGLRVLIEELADRFFPKLQTHQRNLVIRHNRRYSGYLHVESSNC